MLFSYMFNSEKTVRSDKKSDQYKQKFVDVNLLG